MREDFIRAVTDKIVHFWEKIRRRKISGELVGKNPM
jgi:hypothetical protein